MDYSQIRHPYPSRRSVTYGRRGMVATSQTLAAQAGLAMLKQGGNAADAIIATAIAMTVLEPTSNGLGSDAFALYWSAKDHQLFGLNGSGWAPQALTLEAMREKGVAAMPERGWASVLFSAKFVESAFFSPGHPRSAFSSYGSGIRHTM